LATEYSETADRETATREAKTKKPVNTTPRERDTTKIPCLANCCAFPFPFITFSIKLLPSTSTTSTGIRHPVLYMNSSANDSFDPNHSSYSGSDGTPDSSSVYAERYSARSRKGTLLADTKLLSRLLVTSYFPMRSNIIFQRRRLRI